MHYLSFLIISNKCDVDYLSINIYIRKLCCSERSGLGSLFEVLTKALLQQVRVVAENFVILDVGERVSVVGVGLVEEHVETYCSESEVGNCDLVTSDILASVACDSLLNSGDPNWELLEPGLLSLSLSVFILFEVELEV